MAVTEGRFKHRECWSV